MRPTVVERPLSKGGKADSFPPFHRPSLMGTTKTTKAGLEGGDIDDLNYILYTPHETPMTTCEETETVHS